MWDRCIIDKVYTSSQFKNVYINCESPNNFPKKKKKTDRARIQETIIRHSFKTGVKLLY